MHQKGSSKISGIVLALAVYAPTLFALPQSIGAGFGAFEGGDDNLQAGFVIDYSISDYRVAFDYYGRSYGPITENNYLLALGKAMPLNVGFKNLELTYGITLLSENTYVQYWQAQLKNQSQKKEQFNFGGLLSLRQGLISKRNYSLDFIWQHAIFPAGLATIFLVTARKQSLELVLTREFL